MHTTRFLESYLDAWNHHNPEGVAGHLASNGIYCDVPEHAERTHDELIESLESFFARYRHRYELAGEVVASGNAIAFQYRMMPVEDGDNEGIHHGAEFITLAGDGALIIRDYYDVPGIECPPVTTLASGMPAGRRKYAKSGLGAEELEDYKGRLERLMLERQAYLRPDLTLPGLARMLGCSVNHLSQVINAGFGSSFFEYVNEYRVRHAVSLLERSGEDSPAIANVAYAVGFKSNSAFYTAFKKHVGQTPASYRRMRQRQAKA